MTILDEGSIARDGHEDWAEASGADKRFAGAPLTSPLKEQGARLEFGLPALLHNAKKSAGSANPSAPSARQRTCGGSHDGAKQGEHMQRKP